MKIINYTCEECGWEGDTEELYIASKDKESMTYCPSCRSVAECPITLTVEYCAVCDEQEVEHFGGVCPACNGIELDYTPTF